MFKSCSKSQQHKNQFIKFTEDAIISQHPIDSNNCLYGTSQGQLFLYSFDTRIPQLIAQFESDAIRTIDCYNREAFIGCQSGSVYLINLSAQQPSLLGKLNSAVTRLYIFGGGNNLYIYAATKSCRLSAFQLVLVRSSFSGSLNKQPSSDIQKQTQTILQITLEENIFVKHNLELLQSEEESSDSKISHVHSYINLVTQDPNNPVLPSWTQKYHFATPTYLHGCEGIIAFCAEDKTVRFYNILTFQEMSEFRHDRLFPTSCHMFEKLFRGQKTLFCIIGYNGTGTDGGEVFMMNIKENDVFKVDLKCQFIGGIRAISCIDEKILISDRVCWRIFDQEYQQIAKYEFKDENPIRLEYFENGNEIIHYLTYNQGVCGRVKWNGAAFKTDFIE
ncbi:hypothetical protein SS50377_28213 [Spironucleus salmonicida]|uniref:Uncharacterized protein n=1 Tax=Spironucleus salmonicida TaxID=348837 RepID=V6M4W7_9EUKA|nr:hypothetical protein SS50377_28213 [Spironucleus salmonicida]|eukprot:EST48399.1 hypothetical protein SS50377_11347 [Spironucleus salmonicida]